MLTWPSSARTVSTGSMPTWLALSASISSAIFLSGSLAMVSSSRRELAGPFVQQMEHAVGNGKECAAQRETAALLLFPNAWECAQVGEADLDRRLFHRALSS